MEDCRVTLHGVSCPVSTVAPGCIDLEEKPGDVGERESASV